MDENYIYEAMERIMEAGMINRELIGHKKEAIYNRRSIRKYIDEPVPRFIIEQILDAGRVAPSAKNRQPWKYLVYSGEAKD